MRPMDWFWHCIPADRRTGSRDPRSCKLHSCHKDSPEPCTRRRLKKIEGRDEETKTLEMKESEAIESLMSRFCYQR